MSPYTMVETGNDSDLLSMIARRDLSDIKAAEALFEPESIRTLVAQIKQRAISYPRDVSTARGRAEVASLAHRVARTKTLIDEMGKTLVSGWKARAAAIDEQRRFVREQMDELKVAIRAPLTEWEEAEKARIEAEKLRVAKVRNMIEGIERVATSAATCPGWNMAKLESVLDVVEKAIDEPGSPCNPDEAATAHAAVANARTAIAMRKEHIAALDAVEQERAAKEKIERELAELRARTARMEQELARRNAQAQVEAAQPAAAEQPQETSKATPPEQPTEIIEATSPEQAEVREPALSRAVDSEWFKAVAELTRVTDRHDLSDMVLKALAAGSLPAAKSVLLRAWR